MVQRRDTLMNPPIEELLNKVDSKFTLVALSSKRARQINSYYNQLGEGLGVVVPPQVTSVSGKPLTIAFEEISAGKATYHRLEPGELESGEEGTDVLAAIGTDGIVAAVEAVDAAAADAVDAEAGVTEAGSVEATPAETASSDDAAEPPAGP
jgi:DNA-directed RNA polymerase subunit omega